MKKFKYCPWVAFAVALLCSGAIFGTTFYLIVDMESQHQKANLNKIVIFNNRVVQDVAKVLTRLNNLRGSECDEALIREMQRSLFQSRFLKEVGFFKNRQLLCNTSSGVLEAPVPLGEPTFDTGRGIAIHVDEVPLLFDGEVNTPKVLIAEAGHFSVVIEREYIEIFDVQLRHWEIVHRLEHSVHVFGSEGIFRPDFKDIQVSHFDLMEGLYSHRCSTANGYCSATSLSAPVLMLKHFYLLILALILSMGLFLLVYTLMAPSKTRQRSLHFRVRRGLENKGFYPVYQPIVELESGKTVGCEVLSRFQDDHGDLSPDAFIPIIKSSRATWSFTLMQLQLAIYELIDTELPNGFKVSFNVFPEDLTRKNAEQLVEILFPYLSRFDFNLEIIEDELLDHEEMKHILAGLRQHGLSISIDDFGSGYSNLGHLNQFDCDLLKIDRCFVSDMENGSLIGTLVPRIHEIAASFKLQCVAEGVENELQWNLLRQHGIEYGQGWFFGKPMPIESWRAYLINAHIWSAPKVVNL